MFQSCDEKEACQRLTHHVSEERHFFTFRIFFLPAISFITADNKTDHLAKVKHNL